MAAMRRPAALQSPEARPLSARADAGCKLPTPLMYSPPALMVSSMRSLEGEPAVPPSPSVLWPPTPSPTAAAEARAASEQAFRMPMAMATVLEDHPAAPPLAVDGAAFFVPFVEATQQLAAAPVAGCAPASTDQSFFVAQGQVGVQMPVPFWQFAQPPPPPAEPAPGYLPPAAECAPPAPEPSPAAAKWSLEVAPLLLSPAAPAPEGRSRAVGSARPAPAPSAGSALHGSQECRPCAWYYKPKGCDMGMDCQFCHLSPEGEVKNRKKAKVAAIRRTIQQGGDRP